MRSPAPPRPRPHPTRQERPVGSRRRRGPATVLLSTVPVALSVAFSVALAPTAAHAAPPAAPPQETGEAVESTASALGGLVGSLITRLDQLGAFERAESQSVASEGDTTEINLAEAWVAPIARLNATDRPVKVASACAWQIKTHLSVTYDDRGERALKSVVGTPDAALSCGGNFGLPVRQVGTLTHRLNGTTDVTVGTQRCNDPEGCPNTNVTGTYRCNGAACAGTHQLVLEHSWTLPGRYVWQDAPDRCDVSNRGRTLTCTTETKTVKLPATRGGISVGNADAA